MENPTRRRQGRACRSSRRECAGQVHPSPQRYLGKERSGRGEQKRDRREQSRDYYQRNKAAIDARHKARYAAKRDEILAKQREKRHAAKAAKEALSPKPAPLPEPPKLAPPPKPAREPKPAKLPKPAPKHDFVHLKRDTLAVLYRQQRSQLPQCPICGACRENRYIIRVCTACGSQIVEEEQKYDD